MRLIPNFLWRWFYSLRRRVRRRPYAWALGACVAVLFVYLAFFSAPFDFPVGAYVSVPSGQTIHETAAALKERHIIRSSIMFETLVRLFGTKRQVVAGEYFFPKKGNILRVATRLGDGDFEVDPARIRVPEGATVAEIGALLQKNIPDFNLAAFTQAARGKEGYLFPDTYFFMPGQDTDAILGAFANNFSTHIHSIQASIDAYGKPLSDVITMASLLEREAPDTYDRRVIAGILWKRIKLNMPLQVDAVFPYIIGKNSFDLTRADLQKDSPYNTYTNTGLPPGPIANPSLDAILAAVTPISTNYLYYLSDMRGNFHYSATYEQHLAAKNKYLSN
ncbi:MAG TPA: endolytic transglycosylase MltG [Candidatus Paceibacterota bacterium]|nr:endolytic transglycosylase MltG [Candidatus Paceibacterota bacterium]